jgi:hypothetical protein
MSKLHRTSKCNNITELLTLCIHLYKVKYKWGKRDDKNDARYRWKESERSVIRNIHN